jgi:hypothetical protein
VVAALTKNLKVKQMANDKLSRLCAAQTRLHPARPVMDVQL